VNIGAWAWPQWVLLILCGLEVVAKISKHGEPRDPFNGPVAFLELVFMFWLLWCGGFWK
jgi:hypothetical protein